MTSELAKAIRLARKSLKMNQAQFAEALGASQGSISKWEAGRETPRLEALQKIAELAPGFSYTLDENNHIGRPFRQPPPPPEENTGFLAKVPIMGAFGDGFQPYMLEGTPEMLTFPLAGSWKGRRLEAYYYEPRGYKSEHPLPEAMLIVFVILSENDRVDDFGINEPLLVAREGPGGEGWWLVEFEKSKNGPYLGHLWPAYRLARRTLLPIPIEEDGKTAEPGTRVIGLQVCALSYTSKTSPNRLEPTQENGENE